MNVLYFVIKGHAQSGFCAFVREGVGVSLRTVSSGLDVSFKIWDYLIIYIYLVYVLEFIILKDLRVVSLICKALWWSWREVAYCDLERRVMKLDHEIMEIVIKVFLFWIGRRCDMRFSACFSSAGGCLQNIPLLIAFKWVLKHLIHVSGICLVLILQMSCYNCDMLSDIILTHVSGICLLFIDITNVLL